MKKLKGVYLDDDVLMHEVVKDLGNNSPYVEIVRTFVSSKEFVANARNEEYDIYFLDIFLPEINGFEIAKLLKGKHIIFITGEAAALTEAVTFHPVAILMKPINPVGFNIAGKRVVDLINGAKKPKGFMEFKIVGKGKITLYLPHIIYATIDEHDPRDKKFYMVDGKVYIVKRVNFQKLLNYTNLFVQVNRSEILAVKAIQTIEQDVITVSGLYENDKIKQVCIGEAFAIELKKKLGLL